MKTQERNSFVINLSQVIVDIVKERDMMGEEQSEAKQKVRNRDVAIDGLRDNLAFAQETLQKARDEAKKYSAAKELANSQRLHAENELDKAKQSNQAEDEQRHVKFQEIQHVVKLKDEELEKRAQTIIGLRQPTETWSIPKSIVEQGGAGGMLEALKQIKDCLEPKYYDPEDQFYNKYRGNDGGPRYNLKMTKQQKAFVNIIKILEVWV